MTLNFPADLVPLALSVIGVLYVIFQARTGAHLATSDGPMNVLFALVPTVRIGLAGAFPAFILGAYFALADRSAPRWVGVLFMAMGFLTAVLPTVIVTTPETLESRRLWGIWVKRMPWGEIESAIRIPGSGGIEICSRAGSKIRHSGYHVDK